jgi:two-component system chemotaxis response regulator CheY
MVTVLISDDSLFMRELESRILVQAGYDVVGKATSVDEAVALYKKLKPDVTLLDIVMPGSEEISTGMDALKQILTEYPSAKIVICSSLDQRSIIVSALKMGASGFVAKPFSPGELPEVIAACMDLGILLEIGSIGAGHAASALSEIVKEKVTIEVPRLQMSPPHLVPRIYGKHDEPTTAIRTHVQGLDCDVILAFEAAEAKKIATSIAAASFLEPDPALEKSAIEEVGSIMMCSFLSTMADFVGFELIPKPPETVTDSFDSIIDNLLVNQALLSNTALIFETHFRRSSSSAEGILLMFPSVEFQKQLISQAKKWLGISPDISSSSNLETVIRNVPTRES